MLIAPANGKNALHDVEMPDYASRRVRAFSSVRSVLFGAGIIRLSYSGSCSAAFSLIAMNPTDACVSKC